MASYIVGGCIATSRPVFIAIGKRVEKTLNSNKTAINSQAGNNNSQTWHDSHLASWRGNNPGRASFQKTVVDDSINTPPGSQLANKSYSMKNLAQSIVEGRESSAELASTIEPGVLEAGGRASSG